jgi:hypothetical protein
MGQIVQEAVSLVSAPAPITLQSMGSFVSQGGTTLAVNAKQLLTTLSDLTSILAAPLAVSAITWSGGTVQVTTGAALSGISSGDVFTTTLAGFTPTAYNGKFVATVTGTNTFTFALATNPGTETALGTYTPHNVGALQQMGITYFDEGANQACYVVELGPSDGVTGPPLLNTWIQNNPKQIYIWQVPKSWDATSAYLALLNSYLTPMSKTYFFTTTTLANYSNYAGMKDVLCLVESPAVQLPPVNIVGPEYDTAAVMEAALSYNPSAATPSTPFANKYLYGVTPYPRSMSGNNTVLATLDAANVCYVDTGAEGGLPNQSILANGTMQDGNQFTFWLAGDWAQLNGDLVTANEVIVGANSGNPVWYDQPGIDRLQDRVFRLWQTGISYQLLQGSVTRTALDPKTFLQNYNNGMYANQCVINAVPFSIYTAQNPNDFAAGKYAGLTAIVRPKNGFKSIIFAILVTNLISP